jgi:hypothetical protein
MFLEPYSSIDRKKGNLLRKIQDQLVSSHHFSDKIKRPTNFFVHWSFQKKFIGFEIDL